MLNLFICTHPQITFMTTTFLRFIYCILSWFTYVCVSVFQFKNAALGVCTGHSWPGALQDNHYSLLQRRHGLHPNVWHHKWGVIQRSPRLVRRTPLTAACVNNVCTMDYYFIIAVAFGGVFSTRERPPREPACVWCSRFQSSQSVKTIWTAENKSWSSLNRVQACLNIYL